MEHSILFYKDINDRIPFDDWLEEQDSQDADRILVRLSRLKLGNLGNCKTIGEGVNELKIDYGPGYRIYFSTIGIRKILILCAGNKKTQKKDIKKAKDLLKDYKMRGKKHEKN